jgi:two-component sensor histidine kinase/PAS domain-containing protein
VSFPENRRKLRGLDDRESIIDEAGLMDGHDLTIPDEGGTLLRRGASDASRDRSAEDTLRSELDRQKRAFDLAMTASQMGTWRYTLADNMCVYDENAQRLYGLSQARFLHDEDGVKAKFHADDMELMWSRVAKALDPDGDGRYDVEYRVKQPDGSWRWLSAWGLVEFAGEGAARKAVAIAGASRDLTERKQAEDLQRLLLDELNHRVKNTFATIQAIASHTLRSASDLPSARDALEQRIVSMGKAHDLLNTHSWTGAKLDEVVARAVEAFSPAQVTIAGEPVDISSRQTLSLSLALHELATNATKYGALSCQSGRVSVDWTIDESMLCLTWQESDGPPVVEPKSRGFGSRLLKQLAGDVGGTIALDYDPAGVRCRIEIPR